MKFIGQLVPEPTERVGVRLGFIMKNLVFLFILISPGVLDCPGT